ncbi:flagellar hook protein FlgE [Piscinibacter sp.]|uniref:flagellar hook protein FlgE n=1 Tax=Piscinibacter sp. TaxID=1903157 RepID=UPI0039E35FCB
MGFQQGLSGLNATARNLEVIGNNVANANTFGFKSSRAEFADMVSSALAGTGNTSPGIGTRMTTVAQQFTQGNITTTENSLDVAINGAGFFELRDGNGRTLYTRNGQFKIEAATGNIVTTQGEQLIGRAADGSYPSPLRLPTAGMGARSTTRMAIEANLPASATAIDPGIAFDPSNVASYNNATSTTVYDSQGNDLALTYYFRKTAANEWTVHALPEGETTPQTFTLSYDPSGATPTVSPSPASVTMANTPSTGTLNIALDLSTITQYGTAFGVTDLAQDGYAPGQLVGVMIEDNGTITARFSNGETLAAGTVQLVTFRNPQGLQPMGGNAWAATTAAGAPIQGNPGEQNRGMLQSGALEDSNVDLTAELVSMMTAQRIYQANAQTIKTEDAVLQTLVNLR